MKIQIVIKGDCGKSSILSIFQKLAAFHSLYVGAAGLCVCVFPCWIHYFSTDQGFNHLYVQKLVTMSHL